MSSPREVHTHEATPMVSDLELESAILKGVASHRPVGQHKHVLIIALQADVHSQTGIWVPVPNLWQTLEELYDLEALDNMSSSTPSLPGSPDPLSPIPNPRRRRPARDSASPLSSPPPSPPAGPSKSARVIDSPHFKSVFELPLGGDGDSQHSGDEVDFGDLVYARAKDGKDDDSDSWEAGVRAQLAEPEKKKENHTKSTTGSRRTSGGTAGTTNERDRRDTSPLSSASHGAPRRGSRRKKRTRDGESSEDEKPVVRKSRRR